MKNTIRQLRRTQDMTQEEMAKKLGISRVSLSNIERGKQLPGMSLMFMISRLLGKPVEQIFFDDTVLQVEQNMSKE